MSLPFQMHQSKIVSVQIYVWETVHSLFPSTWGVKAPHADNYSDSYLVIFHIPFSRKQEPCRVPVLFCENGRKGKRMGAEVEKRIELKEGVPISLLKFDFGNPRKITKKKKEELRRSMQTYGDFGLILVDEQYNVIGGSQRATVIKEDNPDATVDVKVLIGYSEAELRAINIRDNTHAGEWDMDLLADWTADLNLDLGLDLKSVDPADRKKKEMELINYEKYNYVLLVCRNELDYNELTRKLGINGAIVKMNDKKKLRARAIWYDEISANIVEVGQEKEKDGGGTDAG